VFDTLPFAHWIEEQSMLLARFFSIAPGGSWFDMGMFTNDTLFSGVVAAIVLGLAALFSGFIRIPFWIVALLFSLPFLAANLNLPWALEYREFMHLLVGVSGISFACVLLVGFGIGRVIRAALTHSSGGLRTIVMLLGWGSGLFVTVLYFDKGIIAEIIPGWQRSFGMLFLAVGLLGFTFALLRFGRAFVGLALWLIVVVTVGSEVLFERLPTELIDHDWRALRTVSTKMIFPAELQRKVDEYRGAYAWNSAQDVLRVVVLGGDGALGGAVRPEFTYAKRLQALLEEKQDQTTRVEISNLSVPRQSLFQALQMIDEIPVKEAPDVIILSGWQAESQPNTNFWQVGRLPELAVVSAAEETNAESYPAILQPFMKSELLNFVRSAVAEEPKKAPVILPRISPTEYRGMLLAIADRCEALGSALIVLEEPTEAMLRGEPAALRGYREVLQTLAARQRLQLVSLQHEIAQDPARPLFLKDNFLSAEGHALVAKLLARAILPRSV
jgi:hypothetical protein